MKAFGKFIFLFLFYGIVWFFIYAIPTSANDNVFMILQRSLKSLEDDNHKSNKRKKEINREEVIDALTKAFEPR